MGDDGDGDDDDGDEDDGEDDAAYDGGMVMTMRVTTTIVMMAFILISVRSVSHTSERHGCPVQNSSPAEGLNHLRHFFVLFLIV